MITSDGVMSSVTLQAGSNALVLGIAVSGLVVFMIVLLLRILPLIHKPRVTMRVTGKPPLSATPEIFGVPQSQTGGIPGSAASMQSAADRTELVQAKSQWERLVQEAESNEQLTSEQRETFVEEARKRIGEINKQLEAVA
jgi:hypothetical protein